MHFSKIKNDILDIKTRTNPSTEENLRQIWEKSQRKNNIASYQSNKDIMNFKSLIRHANKVHCTI